MGIEKLIAIASTLALLTVGTGQLPRVLDAVWRAERQLVHDSRTATWGKALLLPVSAK